MRPELVLAYINSWRSTASNLETYADRYIRLVEHFMRKMPTNSHSVNCQRRESPLRSTLGIFGDWTVPYLTRTSCLTTESSMSFHNGDQLWKSASITHISANGNLS